MKYGQIAESKRINSAIYSCFDYVREEDQRRFVKKFREQPHDSDLIMHTFRELVLGAYLYSSGLRLTYEYRVEGKTPDWAILDDCGGLAGIIDLVNFHIDQKTESEMEDQLRATGVSLPHWRDGNKDNVQRLYSSIQFKIAEYLALVRKLGVPYAVAIFPDFLAAIDFGEVLRCMYNESGLFKLYQELSGVLFFEENAGRYYFKYERNPNALHQFRLPSGTLDLHRDYEGQEGNRTKE